MAQILDGGVEIIRVDGLLDVNPAEIRTKKFLTDIAADARSAKASFTVIEGSLIHNNIGQLKLVDSGETYGHVSDQGQTIFGVKTFDSFPETPNSEPTTNYQVANKKYVDDNVIGLWDDRGNYDASMDLFPSTGGSGSGGVILRGDIWTISVGGTLGGEVVTPGQTVRALVDSPAQAAINWAISELAISLWQSTTGAYGNVLSPTISAKGMLLESNTQGLAQILVKNTNDIDNYAGGIFVAKGSGPDFTNSIYMAKYGTGFWVVPWAGNGILATDKNLIISAFDPAQQIRFEVGGGVSSPITRMSLGDDGILNYSADVSPGFGNESVISKRYGDNHGGGIELAANILAPGLPEDGYVWAYNHSGANYELVPPSPILSFINGLSESAGIVKLGGSLLNTEATTLVRTLGSGSEIQFGFQDISPDSGLRIYTKDAGGDNWALVQMYGDRLTIQNADGGGVVTNTFFANTGFSVESAYGSVDARLNNQNKLTDYRSGVNQTGWEYDGDYSANYVDRSLIDKKHSENPDYKSGIDQATAGAAAGELWVDTANSNVVKMGV